MYQSKMFWACALLLVAGASAGTLKDANLTALAKASERDEKLFSVFQIVQFANEACNASDGVTIGTCYTAAECSARNGLASGTCASGFGVCCTATVNRCQSSNVVTFNNTYINSPGFPSGVSTATACTNTGRSMRSMRQGRAITPYTYVITKISTSVSQIRLDFLTYVTDNPTAGNCANGTLSISGIDAVTTKVLPTNLCGTLTGQHVYLSVANSTNVTLTIALSSVGSQSWRILVRQYESTQTDYLAPRGCLQYFRSAAGTISSFNNNNGLGQELINHNYPICINQVSNYCDVALTATSFDLDGTAPACNDKLVFGATTFCGSGTAAFGTAGAYTWPYTGPYNIQYSTASSNTNLRAGFSISYLLLPC